MYRPPHEERLNTLTHGLAVGCIGLLATWLLPLAFRVEDPWLAWSVVTFLVAALCVYVGSTLSHFFQGARQRFFRKVDQAFIYLLIVASYTPISIAYLTTWYWWSVLAAMWFLAGVGFVSKLFVGHRIQRVSVWVYLLLGWLPVLTGMPFQAELERAALAWFLIGGGLYTVGTYFLINDSRIWYFHGIWHLMVLCGTLSHAVMVYHCIV